MIRHRKFVEIVQMSNPIHSTSNLNLPIHLFVLLPRNLSLYSQECKKISLGTLHPTFRFKLTLFIFLVYAYAVGFLYIGKRKDMIGIVEACTSREETSNKKITLSHWSIVPPTPKKKGKKNKLNGLSCEEQLEF